MKGHEKYYSVTPQKMHPFPSERWHAVSLWREFPNNIKRGRLKPGGSQAAPCISTSAEAQAESITTQQAKLN